MLRFKQYLDLQEAKKATAVSATDMEAHIVIAFNGGFDAAKETYGIEKEVWEENKEISIAIANDIREKTKSTPGSMIHFGKGNGKMIDWWTGKATPKTDLYSTDGANISLKKQGGSQLMTGLNAETKSTFKAATIFMGENSPKETDALVASMDSVLKTLTIQGNIDSMTKAIKSKIIPKKLKKIKVGSRTSKKFSDITIDKEKYAQEMEEMTAWKKSMKEITKETVKFFETNDQFKMWFCYEAATGEMKFNPDAYANATWVVEFDPTTGKNNNINQLSLGKNVPSEYIKKLAKKAKFRLSPKTGTGSRVSAKLRGNTTGSLRVTLDHWNKEDTFNNFMQESYQKFTNNILLSEEPLDEFKFFNSVKNWLIGLKDKLMFKLKALAKKGLQYLLDFFEFKIKKIKTSGLELFGY